MSEGQSALLDLETKEVNANWVDEKQPLMLPKNPLHWKAHKLQVLLERLDKQAANIKNGSSFNSQSYLSILNDYIKTVSAINRGENELLDEGDVAEGGNRSKAPSVGNGNTPGVGAGVSADNPFAR